MSDRDGKDFEQRLAERLRRHADRADTPMDARALVQQLSTAPTGRGPTRRWAVAVVAVTVLLASFLTVSALRLVPASSSPSPVPSASVPSAVATPSMSAPSPSAQAEPASLQMTSVAFWADGLNGLVGGGVDKTGRVDRTTDGGRSWTTVLQLNTPVGQVTVTGRADAWIITGCANSPAGCTSLWHSGDLGTTWTEIHAAVSTMSFDTVSFANSDIGWAVTYTTPLPGTPVGGAMPSVLKRTTDGGATWMTVDAGPCASTDLSPIGLLGVVARNSLSAWLLCGGGGAGSFGEKTVAVTTDGGASWQVRAQATYPGGTDIGQIPLSGHASGMAIAPDGTAWMWGGRMVPLASTDGGRTWAELPLGDPDVLLARPAWPLDAQHGYALLWDPNQQTTRLEATSDGGQTWSTRFSWPVSGVSAASASPSL
jgi:photosystem II stability/assembly factor-like uncharacterized protein